MGRTQAVNGVTCTSKGNSMVIVQLQVEALVITLILNQRSSITVNETYPKEKPWKFNFSFWNFINKGVETSCLQSNIVSDDSNLQLQPALVD